MSEASDEPTPSQLFGRRFRAAREAAGWTQVSAAARLGVTQPFVSKVERGVHVPILARIYEIVDALGLDDADLLVRPKGERKGESR